jgi:hypothetical protein
LIRHSYIDSVRQAERELIPRGGPIGVECGFSSAVESEASLCQATLYCRIETSSRPADFSRAGPCTSPSAHPCSRGNPGAG